MGRYGYKDRRTRRGLENCVDLTQHQAGIEDVALQIAQREMLTNAMHDAKISKAEAVGAN